MSQRFVSDTFLPASLDATTAKAEKDDSPVATTATLPWPASPVIDLRRFALLDALPQTARARELRKEAYKFASSDKRVFVHYVDPLLVRRRTVVLAQSKTKKRYPKDAAALWQVLEQEHHEEHCFWKQLSRELCIALGTGALSYDNCLKSAGRPGDATECIRRAEVVVCTYLEIAPPPVLEAGSYAHTSNESCIGTTQSIEINASACEDDTTIYITASLTDLKRAVTVVALQEEAQVATAATGTTGTAQSDINAVLLDALPDRFEYTQQMLYSNFAHYDLDEVRKAEGKQQTAMLRQLANLLDKSGKELFYYFAVPRLCKAYLPPRNGSTVTSEAADMWRFLSGQMKDIWTSASGMLKKQLGDGDVEGLELLQLCSLEPEVLGLHRMVEDAMKSHAAR